MGRNWFDGVKLGLLLAALAALLVCLGMYVGGVRGAAVAFVIALALNFGSYWYSDRLVLAMTRAHEVSPAEAPDLHRIVEELAARAGLPKPRVFIVDDASPNAFATGRDPAHAVVAVTTGILQILDYRQLRAVLGHEFGHVRNRDMLLNSIVATMAAAVMFLGAMLRWAAIIGLGGRRRGGDALGMLLVALLAPIGAALVQLAISRSREYKADADGSTISDDPLALAGALERMEAAVQQVPMDVSPATAHLFIVSPIPGGWLGALFRTHPPTEARIQRLVELAPHMPSH